MDPPHSAGKSESEMRVWGKDRHKRNEWICPSGAQLVRYRHFRDVLHRAALWEVFVIFNVQRTERHSRRYRKPTLGVVVLERLCIDFLYQIPWHDLCHLYPPAFRAQLPADLPTKSSTVICSRSRLRNDSMPQTAIYCWFHCV